MTAGAGFVNVGAGTVGVPLGVARRGAHGRDAGARLLADPFEEHGFDGGQGAVGLGVVAFGDALARAAREQMVAHDPAAAFAVGGLDLLAVRADACGPGGGEPGGVVGVLGEARTPVVVAEVGVPGRAQAVDLVDGRRTRGTGARGC